MLSCHTQFTNIEQQVSNTGQQNLPTLVSHFQHWWPCIPTLINNFPILGYYEVQCWKIGLEVGELNYSILDETSPVYDSDRLQPLDMFATLANISQHWLSYCLYWF